MNDSNGYPWERQRDESSKSFHAFVHYRDLGGSRSINGAFREHAQRCRSMGEQRARRASPTWQGWATVWGWAERAAAWDAQNDRIARDKIAKDQIDARVRHARMANAGLQVLTVPSRAVLEALQKPGVMQRLLEDAEKSTAGLLKLLELVAFAGRVIPGLVEVERLALGMTTDYIEIEERRDDLIGLRIAKDPRATELAIALLDQIANGEEVR